MLQNKSAPTTLQISHFKGYKTQLQVGCNHASGVASLSSNTSPPPAAFDKSLAIRVIAVLEKRNKRLGCNRWGVISRRTRTRWPASTGVVGVEICWTRFFHVTEVDAILMFFFSTCFFFENMSVKCGGVFFGPVENQKADCRVHCHQPSFFTPSLEMQLMIWAMPLGKMCETSRYFMHWKSPMKHGRNSKRLLQSQWMIIPLAYQVISRGHHILGRNPAPIGR